MLLNNHILQENRPLNASKSHITFVCPSDGASFHQDGGIRSDMVTKGS